MSVIPEPGLVLAQRYTVLERIGEGGMGIVYRAHDDELAEEVALKWLRRELTNTPEALEAFRREVRFARRVTHANVARTFDLGVHGDERFITMELVTGESLSARIRREGRLSIPETLRIAEAVVRGLLAAHLVGVVHRDLKPANILLDHERVVLTDFGIACGFTDASVDRSGTPAYMAPEQIFGEAVDGRTDVYAFGVLLFLLLTGTLPLSRDIDERMRQLAGPSRSIREVAPALSPALCVLVDRAMSRQMADRPDSMALLSSVERLRGDLDESVPDTAVTLAEASVDVTFASGSIPHQAEPTLTSAKGEAQSLYERAVVAYDLMLPGPVNEAVALLERAHTLAPDDVRIASSFSAALVRQWFFADGLGDRARLAYAEDLALAAVEKNPRIGQTFATLGVLRLLHGETRASVRAFHAALAREPELRDAQAFLGYMLVEAGEIRRGLPLLERAANAGNVRAACEISRVQGLFGDREEALKTLDDLDAVRGPSSLSLVQRARFSLWWRDDVQREITLASLGRLAADGALASFAGPMKILIHALASGGPPLGIEASIDHPGILARQRSWFLQIASELTAANGERKDALRFLESAADGSLIDVLWMDRCPLFDGLRDDPGFSASRTKVALRAAEVARA